MLAWDGINRHNLVDETWKLLKSDRLNVWTIHAELEGTVYFPYFHEFIEKAIREGVSWVFLSEAARKILERPEDVPRDGIEQDARPGRAGTVTCQLKQK